MVKIYAQSIMNHETHTMHNSPLDFIFPICGGFLGAISFFIHQHTGLSVSEILVKFDFADLAFVCIKSSLGAFIGLGSKLVWDYARTGISNYISKRKERRDDSE